MTPDQLTPNLDGTLRDARAWLRERVDDGERCPCCTQFAKVYRRQINAQMAAALIKLYRATDGEPGVFVHLSTVLDGKRADEAKLVYWELIEEEPARRPDGGRAGWWALTPLGINWVRHPLVSVPRYARTILDALGTRFDYNELMGLSGSPESASPASAS